MDLDMNQSEIVTFDDGEELSEAEDLEAGTESEVDEDTSGDTVDESDAMISLILESARANLGKARKQARSLVSSNNLAELVDSVIATTIDGMLENWRNDPTYNSTFLPQKSQKTQNVACAHRYDWVRVGSLVWVKHPTYDWWVGLIKRIPAKKVNGNMQVSVMFVEPVYEFFLKYVERGLQFRVRDLHPFVPMTDIPNERPDEQILRSNRSWMSADHSFDDHTMFELSERMAVVYAKNQHRMVVDGKLDTELLGALYYLAEIEWRKLTGQPVVHRETLPPIHEFKSSLDELSDVSYWRELAKQISRQSAKSRRSEPVDIEISDAFGYDYIQLSNKSKLDSAKIVYSEESLSIVRQRREYGTELLTVIRSTECKGFLRQLRDAPADDPRHTFRTRARAKKEFFDLMKQVIAFPSGPIADNDLIYELYRSMRFLRRSEDNNNQRFLRDCYDIWLPEALIYAISAVDRVSYEEAETKFAAGPVWTPEETQKREKGQENFEEHGVSMAEAIQR